MMLSKTLSVKKARKKDCYTCQWLDNVDMHLYANVDQKYTMQFKSYEQFTNWPVTDVHTHIVIIVQTQGPCNALMSKGKAFIGKLLYLV